eukprot:3842522-Rhodomonas_salina.2
MLRVADEEGSVLAWIVGGGGWLDGVSVEGEAHGLRIARADRASGDEEEGECVQRCWRAEEEEDAEVGKGGEEEREREREREREGEGEGGRGRGRGRERVPRKRATILAPAASCPYHVTSSSGTSTPTQYHAPRAWYQGHPAQYHGPVGWYQRHRA